MESPSFDLAAPESWRRDVAGGSTDSDVVLRKEFVTEVEAGEDDRTIKFVISTGSADREKDVINPLGWDTSNYLQNPVVLFAHDYGSLPVARTTSLRQEGETLIAEAEFAEESLNPQAEQVYQMLRQGFLRGASVGFRPLTFKYNEERGGVDFEKQELLEFSVVPVPANPGALMSAGLPDGAGAILRAWAKDVLAAAPETKAPVRDQLDDFLDVIRKGMNDIKVAMREVIRNVDEFQNTFQYTAVGGDNKSVAVKGVTPPNPADFGEAPLSAQWKKPGLGDFTAEPWDELADKEKRGIATHFAWAAERVPENFGDLKLPHHQADGDVVWRGVASAAAYLDSTDLPSGDVGAVKRHLASHYQQFDRVAPWERDGAGWSAYCRARAKVARKTGEAVPVERLASLLDDFGFEDEAVVLVTESPESPEEKREAPPSRLSEEAPDSLGAPVMAALDLLSAKLDSLTVDPSGLAPTKSDDAGSDFLELDDDDFVDVDMKEVAKALQVGMSEAVGSEVQAALNTLRGRID
jgi:HK97 family phage prohead protease